MDLTELDQIVNAVLYQDHILYPYRPSAARRRQPQFTPGRIYPDLYSVTQNGAEPCMIQTEGLLYSQCEHPTLNVRVRFLHPACREIQVPASIHSQIPFTGEPAYRVVPEIVVGDKLYQTWQEALEREINISPVSLQEGEQLSITHGFRISAWGEVENLGEGEEQGQAILVRRQEALEGRVEIAATPLAARCFRISVRIRNEAPVPANNFGDHDAVVMRTFAAAHAILHTEGAEFVSMTNPPDEFAQFVNACENLGAWPVLIGDEIKSERHTMLSSPVLLADYPLVPVDNPEETLNATDLGELIELREQTIAAAEERGADSDNAFVCSERSPIRALRDDELRRPGAARRDWTAGEDFFVSPKPVASAIRNGVEIKAGDQVRITPRNHADVLDLMLAGRIATVESLEQGVERIQLSVALLDNAGHDLRILHQPEHRFVYGLDEIEPLSRPLT